MSDVPYPVSQCQTRSDGHAIVHHTDYYMLIVPIIIKLNLVSIIIFLIKIK